MKSPTPHYERPNIPAGYMALWLSMLERRGHRSSRILQGTGLSSEALSATDARVTQLQFMMVVANSIQLTGDATLGYAFGLEMKPTAHGFLGYALMTCPTGRDAIRLGERYVRLRMPTKRLKLSVEGETAVLALEDRIHEQAPLRQFVLEVTTAAISRAAELLLGEKPDGEIWVDYPEPPYYTGLRAHLPRIRFGMPRNELRFPKAYLERSFVLADPLASRQAVVRLEQELRMLGEEDDDVPERVRAILRDEEHPFGELSYVAKRVGMSERTLKRRLKLKGASFQRLLDEARSERAKVLLHDGSVSVDQVAEKLGYGDPANFTRAFRKWTGFSPSVWRKRNGS